MKNFYLCAMPRVKKFNEQEAVQKAMNIFWAKGFEATSLTDLTQGLGIGKGSFYDTFGSKQALFNRALNEYQESGLQQLDLMLAATPDPQEGIERFVLGHTQAILNDPERKGCLVANSSAECGEHGEVQDFLAKHNGLIRSKLGAYLSPKMKDAQAAEALAHLIMNHMTGISVMSKVMKDAQQFAASNQLFLEMVRANLTSKA